MRLASIRSHGRSERMSEGIRARSSICPRHPQEWSGSRRPIPPGQTTAKPPRAGRSRHSRAFVIARTPRPCGEITSGRGGDGLFGPYRSGATTTAKRGRPLWARYRNPHRLTPLLMPTVYTPRRLGASPDRQSIVRRNASTRLEERLRLLGVGHVGRVSSKTTHSEPGMPWWTVSAMSGVASSWRPEVTSVGTAVFRLGGRDDVPGLKHADDVELARPVHGVIDLGVRGEVAAKVRCT